MRIDKYLWCVRYYKTRNIATEACNKGQITFKGLKAKPSKTVEKGDIITLRKDQINYQLKVVDIPTGRVGAKIVDLYRLDQTSPDELLRLENMRDAARFYGEKGVGRPTKKDRRDLDDYQDENNDPDDND